MKTTMESQENESRELQETPENSRELQGTAQNDPENPGGPEGPKGASTNAGSSGDDRQDRRDIPDIVKLLAKRPEMRRELISWVKKEFGFNIESYLEEYFEELPDKKYKIEELAMPLREIAENVLGMTEDGYSPSQIAADLGIYRSQVSKILKERGRWEKEIINAAKKQITQNKKLPWYVRALAKLRLI